LSDEASYFNGDNSFGINGLRHGSFGLWAVRWAGYTHFKVLGGNTSSNGGSSPVSSRVGIGIGSGGYGWGRRGGTRTNVNLGIGINDVARALQGSKVTESIEVVLKRSGSDDPAVYDARSVTESIRPEVFAG